MSRLEDPAVAGARVYVGGLNATSLEKDLEDIFVKAGTLRNLWVAKNPPGFAFVDYGSAEDAEKAVRKFDGVVLHGKSLRVEVSKNNKGPPWKRGGAREDRARDKDRGGGYGSSRYGGGGDRGPGRFGDYRIRVSGLSRDCRWQDLKDLVRKYAHPNNVDVLGGGEGVMDFGSRDDAEYVIRKLDDRSFMGRTLALKLENDRGRDRGRSRTPPRRRRSPTPPRRRGSSRSRSPRRRSPSPSPRKRRRGGSRSYSRSATPPRRRRARSRSASPAGARRKRRSPSPSPVERGSRGKRRSSPSASPSPAGGGSGEENGKRRSASGSPPAERSEREDVEEEDVDGMAVYGGHKEKQQIKHGIARDAEGEEEDSGDGGGSGRDGDDDRRERPATRSRGKAKEEEDGAGSSSTERDEASQNGRNDSDAASEGD